MSPLVKLIVPCYRYADLLTGCVESILAQEGVEVRVLIVDDFSPDRTPEVARALAAGNPHVEYRRNEANLGLIATANVGLDWAVDSDYVVLISADDRLVPGALARAVATMEANPGVGMVYGHAEYYESGKLAPRLKTRMRGVDHWPGHSWIKRRARVAQNCISSPEVVVRTAVHRQAGHYDPACRHASDLNMWLRIAVISDVAYLRGVTQALYRVDTEGMLRSAIGAPDGVVIDLRERRAAFERALGDAPPAEFDGELDVVRRALARQALWRASRAYDRGEVEGEDAVPVEALIEFARETYPDAKSLREWRGLMLRRRIGAGRSILFPPFLLSGAAHRLLSHARHLRWKLQGV